jgi:hypothetical protein
MKMSHLYICPTFLSAAAGLFLSAALVFPIARGIDGRASAAEPTAVASTRVTPSLPWHGPGTCNMTFQGPSRKYAEWKAEQKRRAAEIERRQVFEFYMGLTR